MRSRPLQLLHELQEFISDQTPRPGLHPIPGSKALTLTAALLPPLIYYLALLMLAPPPPPLVDRAAVKLLRSCLALVAGILFFRLPLVYHVPQSIGLTYQLGLVGVYGGCRVVDAFFLSPYLWNHIPRRVRYHHRVRLVEEEEEEEEEEENSSTEALSRADVNADAVREWTNGGVPDPFLYEGSASQEDADQARSDKSSDPDADHSGVTRRRTRSASSTTASVRSAIRKSISGPAPVPVTETATTESGWPTSVFDRAAWALELELSMRGIGFTWTTADVRHTRKTWLPTVQNRVHSILVHAAPVLLVCWAIIRAVYVRYILPTTSNDSSSSDSKKWEMESPRALFDDILPLPVQFVVTASLGAFLMAAFSVGHSLFAILLHPLAPGPLAFFPPLYTTRAWDITSVRQFWSFGWHRLFARLFLVYGAWPGQWLERRILRKGPEAPSDVGKVLGAFACSGFVHTFAVRGVLAGNWRLARGEATFFVLNGAAVVLEGLVVRVVARARRRRACQQRHMWYDDIVGRVWWITVLLWTGRNFARGWVKAGLVREMAFL